MHRRGFKAVRTNSSWTVDRDLEGLALRIRRLALHAGYDRRALVSPLLMGLMPVGRPTDDPATEIARLMDRLRDAGLDADALAYLRGTVDGELDLARLRTME